MTVSLSISAQREKGGGPEERGTVIGHESDSIVPREDSYCHTHISAPKKIRFLLAVRFTAAVCICTISRNVFIFYFPTLSSPVHPCESLTPHFLIVPYLGGVVNVCG